MDIEQIRHELDCIDNELLRLFEQRMALAEKVGQYKKEYSLPVIDKEREAQVLKRMSASVNPKLAEYIKPLFISLFEVSKAYQNKIIST
ncbi:MAG: chorismate mutase [Oscillospiraceae bacterium]|nr:chorismate mutase [Oscillospiraceae bacterium]